MHVWPNLDQWNEWEDSSHGFWGKKKVPSLKRKILERHSIRDTLCPPWYHLFLLLSSASLICSYLPFMVILPCNTVKSFSLYGISLPFKIFSNQSIKKYIKITWRWEGIFFTILSLALNRTSIYIRLKLCWKKMNGGYMGGCFARSIRGKHDVGLVTLQAVRKDRWLW